MFNIGDKIVYPMYGAGVIEDLEQKTVSGKAEQYYVMKMPIGNLKIMLSVKRAESLGVREVSHADEVISIMQSTAARPIIMSDNWNQRYKDNLEKIKTGKLSEVVEVARNLMIRDKARGLSSIEKKMFSSAKQIILSELILSQNIEKEKAEELLSNEIFDNIT